MRQAGQCRSQRRSRNGIGWGFCLPNEPLPTVATIPMRISQPLCECLVSHPSDAQRAYCRVSSQAQKPELANQKRSFEQYCQQQHIEVDEWIMEIGGGMNFKRKHDLTSGGSDSGGGSGAPRIGPTSIGWHVLPIHCWFISARATTASCWS